MAENTPVLYVIGANSAFINRLNREKLNFSLVFLENLPPIWAPTSLLLLFFPDKTEIIPLLPTGKLFLAYGEARFMDDAFLLGAVDYISKPLQIGELKARLGRVFAKQGKLLIPGSNISIEDTLLKGPGGNFRLNSDETILLRTLIRHAGESVSRSALQDVIWPTLPEKSRIVDTAISHLRKYLKLAGGNSPTPGIHAIYGFGYVMNPPNF